MTDNERLARLTGALEELFANLKASRMEVLNEVKELRIVGQVLLQNEAERIDKKFGADHPRTRSLRSSLEQNLNHISDLEVETEIARINIPEVGERQTLIHGRVTDEKFRGMEGFFVSMADENAKTLIPLGMSDTDVTGYYALVVDTGALEKVLETVREGVFLTVRTRKDEIVHREFEPLTIAEGDRVTLDVILKRNDLIGGASRAEYVRKAGYEASGASEEVELEDVRGIGPLRAEQLRRAGITDVRALSEADDERLKDILGNVDVQKLKQESVAVLERTMG
jgi:Helix-hairpin-helix domain